MQRVSPPRAPRSSETSSSATGGGPAAAKRRRLALLQMRADVIRDHRIEVALLLGIDDAVPVARIHHQLEELVRLLQLVRELQRILRVHVLVDLSADDQETPREILRRVTRRALLVALGIVLRQSHEALDV